MLNAFLGLSPAGQGREFGRFARYRAGGVSPAFVADFAEGVYYRNRSVLGIKDQFTIARASTKTRVGPTGLIETVAANEPALTYDPVTGEALGLLVEPQATNLFPESEDFSSSDWAKFRVSLVSGQSDPAGGTNAFKMVENTDNDSHYISDAVVTTSGVDHTASAFIKAAERGFAQIILTSVVGGNAVCGINLSTGATLASGQVDAVKVEEFPGGWWRLSISAETAATTPQIQIRIANSLVNTPASYTGDGTSGIFVWGAQLETGSVPTSYIPTTGSTATRAADSVVDSSIGDWFNDSEGTFVVEGAALKEIPSTPINSYFSVDQTSAPNNNLIRVWNWSGDTTVQVTVTAGGAAQFNNNVGGLVTDDNKIALAYQANNFAAVRDGGAVVADTSGAVPTGIDRLNVGQGSDPSFVIKRILYYPSRLPNAVLQELTA